MKILQMFMLSIVALSLFSFVASAKNAPMPDNPVTTSNQESRGNSFRCYTQWAYDDNLKSKGWYKRDLIKTEEWTNPKTKEVKIVEKIIRGDRCKAYNPYNLKLSSRPPKEVSMSFNPRSYALPYNWKQ